MQIFKQQSFRDGLDRLNISTKAVFSNLKSNRFVNRRSPESTLLFRRGGNETVRIRNASLTLSKLQQNSPRADVELPKDLMTVRKEEERENMCIWFHYNLMEFVSHTDIIFSACTESNQDWLVLNKAGGGFPYECRYLWRFSQDSKPMPVSADSYGRLAIDWCKMQLEDVEIFPIEEEGEFRADCEDVVKMVMKRLLRVYILVLVNPCLSQFARARLEGFSRAFQQMFYFGLRWSLFDTNDFAPIADITHKYETDYKRDTVSFERTKSLLFDLDTTLDSVEEFSGRQANIVQKVKRKSHEERFDPEEALQYI